MNLTDDGWLTWESGPRNFTWVSLSGLELTTAPWARRVLDPASNVEHGDGNMLGARIQRYGGVTDSTLVNDGSCFAASQVLAG